jgi:outer membrane protein assembly factor BamB
LNSVKKLARRPLIGAAILAVVLAASCVPIRQEASWPALSVIGDEQNIVVAYWDRVVMVNPEDGLGVKLRTPDGEVRVDENGNARLWDFRGPEGTPNQFYASPVLADDDTLLIPSYNNRLFEVGLTTARADRDADGDELLGQAVSNPVLANDLIYLGYGEGDLVALDANNRTEQWRVDTNQAVWSQPLIVDDVLYFTSLDHYLYAVNPVTGAEIWKLDLQGAAPEAPIFYEGNLYVGSFARKLFKISLDGEVLAEFTTRDWVWSVPSIVDDVLYAGDMGGSVYALDISGDDFRQIWQAQVSGQAIRTTPLVANDYVIVGSRDQKVYWLNRADGSIFWSREVGGEVLSNMLLIEPSESVDIDEPLVIVGTPTHSEVLVAFTLQNGERAWGYGYS